MNEQLYALEEIKAYILSQDSLGDVLYNLKHENLRPENEDVLEDEDDIGKTIYY